MTSNVVVGVVVDGLKIARDRQRLTGNLSVASLPRLVQSLHAGTGSLDYAIVGDSDARERPLLRLKVTGAVQLQCQRCLEGMEHQLVIDSVVRLVAAEALETEYEAIGANPDEPDCIVASKTMDVALLVEDDPAMRLSLTRSYRSPNLNDLIARVKPGGEVVLAGFYKSDIHFAFAPAFMREVRLRIAAEWKRPDLLAVERLIAQGRLQLDDLITHIQSPARAEAAYAAAFGDVECLKMVLDWSTPSWT